MTTWIAMQMKKKTMDEDVLLKLLPILTQFIFLMVIIYNNARGRW